MGGGATHVEARATRFGTSWRALLRLGGSLMVVAGVVVIAWTAVVWQWKDPFTTVYTAWQQHRLSGEYAALVDEYRPPATGRRDGSTPGATPLGTVAARYRRSVHEGAAIARIRVPRLGLNAVVVDGTGSATLKKGPGRHARTFMPGEGKLVYVAGHRTTFGAPFGRIDGLRRGDRITIETPYGTFIYRATARSIVDAADLSVLRSHGREQLALQACHPRFFATQRYIVWAQLERVRLAPGLRGRVQLPALPV